MNKDICKTCFTNDCKNCLYVHFKGKGFIKRLKGEIEKKNDRP